MRASTKRILSIVSGVFLIIASLVVFSNFISPAYEEIKTLRGEVAARTKILAEQENAIKQVQNLISQFESFSRLQDTISLSLPMQQNLPHALAQYQGLAKSSGVSIQSLSLQTLAIDPPSPTALATLAKGAGRLRFNLKILGSYKSLRDFLTGLETSIRLADVFDLKIERGADKEDKEKDLYLGALTVDNYYQAQ